MYINIYEIMSILLIFGYNDEMIIEFMMKNITKIVLNEYFYLGGVAVDGCVTP
jgi:hypothetical protein